MLYDKRINMKLSDNIANRCCDFALLEEKYKEYIKNLIKQIKKYEE